MNTFIDFYKNFHLTLNGVTVTNFCFSIFFFIEIAH